jgi:predicted transcriptional regulator
MRSLGRLSEELLAEALSRKEWRRAALLAVLKEAVTKDDIRELRAHMDTRIDDLNRRIDNLARGIKGVNSYMRFSLIVITVTLAATIAVPFIIRLLLGA